MTVCDIPDLGIYMDKGGGNGLCRSTFDRPLVHFLISNHGANLL